MACPYTCVAGALNQAILGLPAVMTRWWLEKQDMSMLIAGVSGWSGATTTKKAQPQRGARSQSQRAPAPLSGGYLYDKFRLDFMLLGIFNLADI